MFPNCSDISRKSKQSQNVIKGHRAINKTALCIPTTDIDVRDPTLIPYYRVTGCLQTALSKHKLGMHHSISPGVSIRRHSASHSHLYA